MEIITAKNSGFCFGVRRATDTLENEIANNQNNAKIYTYGEIIHNDQYQSSLISRGINIIGENDINRISAEASAGVDITVVIRAHGITKSERDRLYSTAAENQHLKIIDCTCPYVLKIHEIANRESGENSVFIVIGDSHHPEVKGIMSWVRCEGHVFASWDELRMYIIEHDDNYWRNKNIILTAQTTQNISEWKKCEENIKKLYTNVNIFDTICNVTAKRQSEAQRLSSEVDVMLVIGGKHSSNTEKLYEICSSRCKKTYRIETKNDIPSEILGSTYKVGITAGASTPDGIIEEVKQKMTESETMKSFEQMIDDSIKTLNTGDIVTGTVTSVSGTEVHLDLGAKSTGIITLDQFTDDQSAKLADLVKVGDEIKAFVIKVSDVDGIATLSKRRVDSDASWYSMEETERAGTIVEGKVIEAVKGGVVMNVNGIHVFIPASLSGVPRDGDLNTLVGTTQRVKIKEVNVRGKRAYGSIRDAARIDRKAREDAFWNTAEKGMKYTGTVKNIAPYGAFVEIAPGIEGMVHVSELSWKHVRHPSDVVSVGDSIEVYIIDLSRERHRISLGCKTEETNPWTMFTSKYSVGDTVKVKIVSFTPFGAFAEVMAGQDGLIHISEISDKRVAKPSDILEIGQEVDTKIIAVDDEKKKISLSIKALYAEPQTAEEDIDSAYEDEGDALVYSTDSPDDSVYTDDDVNA